jgi:hypothetical protein
VFAGSLCPTFISSLVYCWKRCWKRERRRRRRRRRKRRRKESTLKQATRGYAWPQAAERARPQRRGLLLCHQRALPAVRCVLNPLNLSSAG